MNADEDNPLKAALGGFVDELVSGERLDPDRIIAVGREHRRRRRAASVASTLAVLLVAGGVAYGLQGHGNALGAADGTASGTARVSGPATPPAGAVATPAKGTLKGTVLGSGITDGVSWEVSAALDGYANGNSLPQFCLYVWTSNGSTDPKTCEGPIQPDPPDPVAPSHMQAGYETGTLPKSALAFAGVYTSGVDTVEITAGGESVVQHPVTLAPGVDVTGAVIPAAGASLKAIGPNGTYTEKLSSRPL